MHWTISCSAIHDPLVAPAGNVKVTRAACLTFLLHQHPLNLTSSAAFWLLQQAPRHTANNNSPLDPAGGPLCDGRCRRCYLCPGGGGCGDIRAAALIAATAPGVLALTLLRSGELFFELLGESGSERVADMPDLTPHAVREENGCNTHVAFSLQSICKVSLPDRGRRGKEVAAQDDTMQMEQGGGVRVCTK